MDLLYCDPNSVQEKANFRRSRAEARRREAWAVKVLQADNGGELCSDAFDDYCRKEGIVRHHTIPYTPQQLSLIHI